MAKGIAQTVGNGAILLTSWSESGVCDLERERSEITLALNDGSGVARQ